MIFNLLELAQDLAPFRALAADAAGTDDAARRLERVLWNDPATGVMRHADAGYEIARECAREQGLDIAEALEAFAERLALFRKQDPDAR